MRVARRIAELAESATLAVSAKAARMRAEGIDLVGFGAGEPDFPTPSPIVQAGIGALEAGHTGYANPTCGLLPARKAVCTKLARDNGLAYSPDQVIITSGGKMACYLAIHALVDPGDEVLIPKPYWVSYPQIVHLAGAVPVYVTGPEDRDFKLSPADLDRALSDRTRLVLINSPSNPTGVTYSPSELRALAEVLMERDLSVISDEIYDQLVFDGQQTLSYAAVGEAAQAQTVTINSASKTFAMAGWRLGYAAGPVEVIKAMAKLQSHSTSGAATFSQYALADALTGNHDAFRAMRSELERRGRHMWQRLSAMPGVRCPKPTGAFYCFPNLSVAYRRLGVSGSIEFADRLIEEAKVAVVPGVAFGMDSHVRLSFATSMENIDKGLDRLAALLG